MIGILVQLLISWVIIWFFEKGNLSVLGFYPTTKRVKDFVFFLLVTAACSSSAYFLRIYFAKEQWMLNPQLSLQLIAEGLWWNIKSVFFEELIFRGVLLYILIKKFGATKAIIISSIAFGIYHWFSQEVFGNPLQMAIVFITTGAMGLIYAYGYAKSFSLFIPFAIHIGWNVVRSVVFSETVIGDQLWVQVKPAPQVQVSYFVFFLVIYFPILSALLINFFLLKRMKQAVVMLK
jgi:membrane protease YdiL (CAAX protease family)